MTPMRSSCQHPAENGFTLVELMAVVAIVGILALIAAYGMRRYISYSKSGEALAIIADIKSQQESYKNEVGSYLSVTDDFDATTIQNYYPANTKPGRNRVQWGGGDSNIAKRWAALGVNPAGPVTFVYACVAGSGTAAPPAPGISITGWPNTAQNIPYYVVKARADFEEGGDETTYVAPSFSNQIFSSNEGE